MPTKIVQQAVTHVNHSTSPHDVTDELSLSYLLNGLLVCFHTRADHSAPVTVIGDESAARHRTIPFCAVWAPFLNLSTHKCNTQHRRLYERIRREFCARWAQQAIAHSQEPELTGHKLRDWGLCIGTNTTNVNLCTTFIFPKECLAGRDELGAMSCGEPRHEEEKEEEEEGRAAPTADGLSSCPTLWADSKSDSSLESTLCSGSVISCSTPCFWEKCAPCRTCQN